MNISYVLGGILVSRDIGSSALITIANRRSNNTTRSNLRGGVSSSSSSSSTRLDTSNSRDDLSVDTFSFCSSIVDLTADDMSISSDEAHSDMDLSVSTNGKPKCSEPGCTNIAAQGRRGLCRRHADGTKKCSVDGCTNNASSGNKKCTRHLYSCSFEGCDKHGQIVSDNGKFCDGHARTEAPEAYAQYRERRNLRRIPCDPCSITGCTKRGQIVNASNGRRFCSSHAKTKAPDEYAQYRERRNSSQNERRRNNPNARIAHCLRTRLSQALKKQGTSHQGKLKLLGCTVNQFKRYLALFFIEPGNRWMDWGNHGRQEGIRCWEMDHIYPLSELNLTDPEVLRRAAHWSNFQPLSAADNNVKGVDIPVGFEWRDDLDRWWWSEDNGRTNYDLPAADAEDVTNDDDESDEFDESDDEDNDE